MTPETRPLSVEARAGGMSAAALLSVLLFTLSGCVVASDSAPEQPHATSEGSGGEGTDDAGTEEDDLEVIASSVTTSTDIGSDLQIDVYALERLENDLLRLRMGVTNNSSESFILGYGLSGSNDEDSASDISLIDSANQKRYRSLKHTDTSCFCNALPGALESGSTEELWVMYPNPPADVRSMSIVTPLTPPMLDVPVSRSSESVESGDLESDEVLNLTLISDSLDGDQTGRTESGDEVSIILSSDVLFDTGSSDLSNEAQEILEQVAQEIDDAGSSVVSVDGYADDTGNDAVNLPLSEDRAASVESSLIGLITRESITFEAAGHGSADPIASNATEEGRERNRRVSVTFEK
ncbi:OmpA family protein [Nocardiopsis sp. B62]|uniref:OmpA family protein n=1 Tax=Nocardiopsis sp. B62 TaxID=2824874 RepID=UPI001FFC5688|nr:OmpA family protein [Nocardiopsis sp. B62]